MLNKIISLTLIIAFLNIIFCPKTLARGLILEKGTKVNLKLLDKISSETDLEGNEVLFKVAEDVKFIDITLIKEGTVAKGYISELYPRGRIGKAGMLTIDFDYTKAIDGQKVPLSGSLTKKGEDKLVISLALAVFTSPVGIVFSFDERRRISISRGLQVLRRLTGI
ncbi:MAG: hypothetical protein MZU97_26815 [Bacillus subtilis]|nr:hypothetical protein [Bacillus subtilis]